MVDLVYMAAIAIVAAGAGLTILRRIGPIYESRAEELVFSLGLGLGVLALVVMALGFAHLLYPGAFYALLAAGALLGGRELIGLAGRLQGYMRGSRVDWRSFYFWLALLIGCGLVLNLFRALTPAHGAVDPLAYHLALPKLYLLRHYLSFERTLTGALYADNVGMLFLLAIGLRDATLAQVVHWFMGVTTVVAIWCFCRRRFNSEVGVWAAAIYAFTPVFVYFSPVSYVDVGVGMFQFLGLWSLFNWWRESGRRHLVLTAVFMGLAMGSKHTGIFIALVAGGMIAGRSLYNRESPMAIVQSVVLYGAVALGLALPWYARAMWEAGNPVWPVANSIFHGLPYKGSFSLTTVGEVVEETFFDRAGELFYWSVASLWEWAWSEQWGWQKATGIYYVALLPGVVVYWRRPGVRWLVVAGLAYYLLAVLYIDGNPRYNLALFALFSVPAGYVAEQLSRQRVRALGLVVRVAFVCTLVGNIGQGYALSYKGVDYVFSSQTPQGFLIENEGNYQAFRFVDKHLPIDAKVLLQGIVKGYYCERVYMWDHPYQMLLQYREHNTPADLLARMRELEITHIVRMIRIPVGRVKMVGYPQYFADAMHEEFRKKYLKLLHRDPGYVVFEVVYPS